MTQRRRQARTGRRTPASSARTSRRCRPRRAPPDRPVARPAPRASRGVRTAHRRPRVGRVRPRAGARPTPVRRPGPGRWPRWPSRRRPSSAPAARARRSSGRTRASVRRAAVQSGISLASLTRQRPASCSTISFESSSRWTSRAPSSRGQVERADDAGVLGDVVGLDAEVVRDRGVRARPAWSRASGRGEVEQGGPERGRPRVAARRPVGPDDEAAPRPPALGPASVGRPGRRPPGPGESVLAQIGARVVGGVTGPAPGVLERPAARPRRPTGSSSPRSLRQTIWSGS